MESSDTTDVEQDEFKISTSILGGWWGNEKSY